MSHHGEDHAQGGAGHAHPAPGLPEVKDEAGDTPPWVRYVGIIVVGALIGLLVYALKPASAPSDTPAADEQTEAAAEAEKPAE